MPKEDHKYLRITNPAVAWHPLVRDDSRYVLLPIMPPTKIEGWNVYDTETGRIINPIGRTFTTYPEAREWAEKEYDG